MAINFPTSLDNFTNPSSTDTLDSITVPHATQHANANDALEAVEAKVGTGASTPIVNRLLRGTGTGTSAWAQVAAGDYAAGSIADADIGTGILPSHFDINKFGYLLNAATSNDKTGDAGGTAYVVLFNTAINSSTDYNTGTGIYTVPAGRGGTYRFSTILTIANLGPSHTDFSVIFVTTSGNYYLQSGNAANMRNVNNALICGGSVDIPMSAGDTIKVQLTVVGTSKTVGINGNASLRLTYFEGYRIN